MKRLFLLLILVISLSQASPIFPINSTKTAVIIDSPTEAIKTTATTTKGKAAAAAKATDTYDEYDEKYYKDYYDDDYLGEVAEKDENKRGSNKNSTVAMTVTEKSKTGLAASKMPVVAPTAPPAKANQSEYDFSDYYDDNDYYDQVEDKSQPAKTTTKRPGTTTTTVGTRPVAKMNSREEDYEDYAYDEGGAAGKTTTRKAAAGSTSPVPTLRLKQVVETGKKPSVVDARSTTNSPGKNDFVIKY